MNLWQEINETLVNPRCQTCHFWDLAVKPEPDSKGPAQQEVQCPVMEREALERVPQHRGDYKWFIARMALRLAKQDLNDLRTFVIDASIHFSGDVPLNLSLDQEVLIDLIDSCRITFMHL